MYKPEEHSAVVSIYILYLSRYKIIILSCKVVSFVISIGQGVLIR